MNYEQIRTDTAECLYLVLQSKDIGIETDSAEEIILETEWCVASVLSLGLLVRVGRLIMFTSYLGRLTTPT